MLSLEAMGFGNMFWPLATYRDVIPAVGLGFLFFGLFPFSLFGVEATPEVETLSLKEVEEKLESTTLELEGLANPTIRGGVGNVGWSSKRRASQKDLEWVRVLFQKRAKVDEIVLVPSIWRDASKGLEAEGFPLEFEVSIGDREQEKGVVVASFDSEDRLLPRIAPLVLPIEPTLCDWVEVRASVLSPLGSEEASLYAFGLAEVMAFAGQENVALHGKVNASSEMRNRVSGSVSPQSIADGTTPYVIDAATGKPSKACVLFYAKGEEPSLVFDLGEPFTVDQLLLHAPDFSESVPQIRHADYGMPRAFRLEGALQSDFSDAVHLLEYERKSIYEVGSVLALTVPPTSCRFVRLVVLQGYKAPEARDVYHCIGFSEVEIFSAGVNVSRGKEVREEGKVKFFDGSLVNLVDGDNHFGRILSIRDWMEQLGRRHDLSLIKPVLEKEVLNRYQKQGRQFTIFGWLAVLLVIGLVGGLWWERKARTAQVERIKKRFVADLHDEVGANLHAIGLLSDVMRGRVKSEQGVLELLDEVRVISDETSEATRHCTSMLEATGLCEDLEAEMRRSASRLMLDIDCKMKVVAGENLQLLLPRKRIDLLLFFKECLTNVVRHAHATRVEVELRADGKQVSLFVKDNGEGTGGRVSSSLRRRARLLGAKLNVGSEEGGGTCVSLLLKNRKLGFFNG